MEKSIGQKRKDELFYKAKHACDIIDEQVVLTADEFCEGYKFFLDTAKTEREAVEEAIRLAKEKGFTEFCADKKYAAGDKVYLNNRGKSLILAVFGKQELKNGVRVLAAHIDSPRLDLKPRPVYEDNEICLFKTHYYGGIKKYQWTAIPLSLHGVVAKKDGTKVKVCIGENDTDPQFTVTDLLPHLAKDQMSKNLSEGIAGEALNILVGSRPFKDDKASEKTKLAVLDMLNKNYGITEGDFLSAEFEVTPAFKARDIGFDRSMIGAYGQDDRVCAYTALMATLNAGIPEKTVVTVLADKEETGSEGNTGMQSHVFEFFIEDIAAAQNTTAGRVLSNSQCLSADVNAAFDPNYPEVMEKNNASFINHGVVITKYTGARGKSSTSDASAEYMGEIRRILDGKNVVWQTGELGKVDQGGGGTVAMYIANLNVDVVDLGVPVLSMHAPLEVTSKLDVYMAYSAFDAFIKD